MCRPFVKWCGQQLQNATYVAMVIQGLYGNCDILIWITFLNASSHLKAISAKGWAHMLVNTSGIHPSAKYVSLTLSGDTTP